MSCLQLISMDRAREKSMLYSVRLSACGHHSSAINGSSAVAVCQCSSRYNVRWSGTEGTTNGGSMHLEVSSCLIPGRVHGHCGKGPPAGIWNSLWGMKVLGA